MLKSASTGHIAARKESNGRALSPTENTINSQGKAYDDSQFCLKRAMDIDIPSCSHDVGLRLPNSMGIPSIASRAAPPHEYSNLSAFIDFFCSDVAFKSSLVCARNATINPDNALAFGTAHDLDIAVDLGAEFGVRT
jgi:hypothetical protein